MRFYFPTISFRFIRIAVYTLLKSVKKSHLPPVLSLSLVFRTPIATAFVESAQRLNYSNINYNSGDQIGVSYLQSSTKNGWRQTAARAFLSSVRHRPNLDISLRSWATKLLFNSHGDQVKAVKFFRNRREYTVKVRKEVILAAGAIQSPKLLMLSGIGPEAHLKDLDIKVVKVCVRYGGSLKRIILTSNETKQRRKKTATALILILRSRYR